MKYTSAVLLFVEGYDGKKNCFILQTRNPPRKLYFTCKTKEDVAAWVAGISSQVDLWSTLTLSLRELGVTEGPGHRRVRSSIEPRRGWTAYRRESHGTSDAHVHKISEGSMSGVSTSGNTNTPSESTGASQRDGCPPTRGKKDFDELSGTVRSDSGSNVRSLGSSKKPIPVFTHLARQNHGAVPQFPNFAKPSDGTVPPINRPSSLAEIKRLASMRAATSLVPHGRLSAPTKPSSRSSPGSNAESPKASANPFNALSEPSSPLSHMHINLAGLMPPTVQGGSFPKMKPPSGSSNVPLSPTIVTQLTSSNMQSQEASDEQNEDGSQTPKKRTFRGLLRQLTKKTSRARSRSRSRSRTRTRTLTRTRTTLRRKKSKTRNESEFKEESKPPRSRSRSRGRGRSPSGAAAAADVAAVYDSDNDNENETEGETETETGPDTDFEAEKDHEPTFWDFRGVSMGLPLPMPLDDDDVRFFLSFLELL